MKSLTPAITVVHLLIIWCAATPEFFETQLCTCVVVLGENWHIRPIISEYTGPIVTKFSRLGLIWARVIRLHVTGPKGHWRNVIDKNQLTFFLRLLKERCYIIINHFSDE